MAAISFSVIDLEIAAINDGNTSTHQNGGN